MSRGWWHTGLHMCELPLTQSVTQSPHRDSPVDSERLKLCCISRLEGRHCWVLLQTPWDCPKTCWDLPPLCVVISLTRAASGLRSCFPQTAFLGGNRLKTYALSSTTRAQVETFLCPERKVVGTVQIKSDQSLGQQLLQPGCDDSHSASPQSAPKSKPPLGKASRVGNQQCSDSSSPETQAQVWNIVTLDKYS